MRAGKNVLLCIDVKGARVVSRQHPAAVKVFIKAPSLTVLKDRLEKRASESKGSLAKRLRIAHREMKEEKHYHYSIVNNRLTDAVKKLEIIVLKELKGGAR